MWKWHRNIQIEEKQKKKEKVDKVVDVGREYKDKEILNCRIHCEGTVEKVSLINLLVTDPKNSVH